MRKSNAAKVQASSNLKDFPQASDSTLLQPILAQEKDGATATRPVANGGPPEPWVMVRSLALRHLDLFASLEPEVLRGDNPDAVHDIRVASRRLQTVLDLLIPRPRSAEARKLRRRIIRYRRALSEVRNFDMLIAKVGSLLARKRTARRAAWTAIHDYLLAQRKAAFQKAARKTSKTNLSAVYVRLKELLAAAGAPAEDESATPAATETMEGTQDGFFARLRSRLEQVWEGFESRVELSRQEPSSQSLHRVRIAAKRLRYLVEILHEFGEPGSADTLFWLRDLQKHLGGWHDLEILEQKMIEIVARPDFLRDHLDLAFEIEKLMVRNRRNKKLSENAYFEMIGKGDGRIQPWIAYGTAPPSAPLARI